MAEYTSSQALATRLLAKKGFTATIRTAGTASDPVTGAGQANGTPRTMNAVKVRIDQRAFPDEMAQKATAMLICDATVSTGEYWIDGSAERPIIAVMPVEPDNASHVITKALIGA